MKEFHFKDDNDLYNQVFCMAYRFVISETATKEQFSAVFNAMVDAYNRENVNNGVREKRK